MDENILVVVAHSDDQIIGAGGTTAKYASEGATVKTVIFFSGEETHPHFQEEIIVNTRMNESLQADKVVGGKGINFFSFTESSFREEDFPEAREKLVKIIDSFKPTKIFTHSAEDTHPGHKKVNKIVLDAVDSMNRKIEVYVFDIWNPFRFNKRKHASLIIDISQHFKTKTKALKSFKSQFSIYGFLNVLALVVMYVKNVTNGWKYKTKYAEVFYKIR